MRFLIIVKLILSILLHFYQIIKLMEWN